MNDFAEMNEVYAQFFVKTSQNSYFLPVSCSKNLMESR